MIKTKKQMFIVIGAFALVMLLGTVTYAFFNYTRTGSANIIKTGEINFNSEQGTAMNLTNMFPIDPTETGIMNDATKVGTVTINVTGDTTYSDGIEYLVSAVNVQNSVGSKHVPISINVSVENNSGNDPATSLGTSDSDYFTNRGPSAGTSIYKVLATDAISEGDQLVVGYIKSGQDGVDGNIVIKAYIDKNKVGISDTYPEETVREVVGNYSTSACETALTGVQDASTICASSEALEGAIGSLTNEQLTALVTAGVLTEYTNGTPTSFGEGRTILTTTEWNSLQQGGVSFQVKVEANEGTWVEEPTVPLPDTIASCPDCVYKRMNENGTYLGYGVNGEVLQSTDYVTDYRTLLTATRKDFLGLIIDSGTGKITRAFACGVKGNVPFCIEGVMGDSKYSDNLALLQGATLYNNTCTEDNGFVACVDASTVSSQISDNGMATVYTGDNTYGSPFCRVDYDGYMDCNDGTE